MKPPDVVEPGATTTEEGNDYDGEKFDTITRAQPCESSNIPVQVCM